MTVLGRPVAARAGASRLVAVVVAGALAVGCASGSPPLRTRATEQRDLRVERLEERVIELQRRLSVTEVELERLRREVARLGGTPIERTRSGSTGSPSARDRSAETGRSADATPSRSRPERGSGREAADRGFEIEDIEPTEPPASRRGRPVPPATPPAAVEEPGTGGQDSEPDSEPEPVRVRPPTPETDEAPLGRSGRSNRSEPAELTREAQALYDQGYALYHQGRFVDAESTFQQFLQSHAGTELGDNAQYWIGEARFARGDLKGALAAFRETARRFPDGNKVPDALLKAGETRAAMGDREGAVETYREILRSFSGTTAAAVARDRLAELGG